MDGAKLQARIYKGYGKSAQYIGLPYAQYRPVSALNAVSGAPINPALLASFNAQDMKYGKANVYGKPLWFCLADGAKLRVADYLISGNKTYFIAGMQALLPILAVDCNRIINVTRPQSQTQVGGLTDYEGTTAANETPIMTGWPASILQGTKGEKGDTQLPGDTRSAWWLILFPAFPGVTIRANDLIADDIGRRYIISSAELTDLGWRLVAMQSQT